MSRLSAILILVIASTAIDGSAQNNKSVGWPFGTNQGDGPTANKRDLFNLGLLGAKAWDADREEPAAERGSGKRRFSSSGETGEDVGPKRLIVRALFGGGPAQKAGLRIDDVIIGAGQHDFAAGCYAPLAEELMRAESTDGKIALQVERGGETLTLTAKLPKGGKDAADPTAGKARAKILKASLAWLADRQGGDGGYPETLGGNNGAVVHACLAGLAWIAGGSTHKSGKHKANIDKATKFVLRGLYAADPFAGAGGGGNWDQTTWAFAHAAVFLGELQVAKKDKKLRAELQKIATTLCQRQEASGGYGHGPGGKNALGYIELNILGAYVLCGLSLAQQAGCEIDEQVVQQLGNYLRESASDKGGVGYSAGAGQKGMGNIGRSAASWLGSVGLGLRDAEWTKTMESYVRENVAEIMGGHASLQQHILLAGVAAKALGEEATAKFWDGGLRRDFVLARAPDGSLQPRPWHESLLMQSNTDVSMGEVWSTASWAIVLGADPEQSKGGLPGWCGTRVE